MKRWTNATIEELSIEMTANGFPLSTPEGQDGIFLGRWHRNVGPVPAQPGEDVQPDDGKEEVTTVDTLS